MNEPVNVSEDRHAITITLNSPSNRNALSIELVTEVHRALDLAEGSGRLVVMRATGTTFCAGADLKERTASSSGSPPPDVFERLVTLRVPVIAVVEGAARAGGIGLVAAADIAIGTSEADFAVSEVHRGLLPAVISVVCAQRLNFRLMQQYFLTGERFGSATAVSMGLLSEAIDSAEVETRLDEIIQHLRRGAPSALAGTKALIQDTTDRDLSERFVEMRDRSRQAFESVDGQEGMLAFLEKRAPRWMINADEL